MFSFSVPLGKLVRRVSRLRGGGSALPGLVVEKIDPGFMQRTLSTLPHGVAVVSGTNGKTTTTKMVVELLESQGLKVFTNRTGSNFTRGVAAALLGDVDWRGRLDADVAVLELDEAHAVHFVNQCPAALQPAAERAPRPAGPLRRDRQDRPAPPAHRLQDHRDRGAEPRGPAGGPDRRYAARAPRSSTSAWTTRC